VSGIAWNGREDDSRNAKVGGVEKTGQVSKIEEAKKR